MKKLILLIFTFGLGFGLLIGDSASLYAQERDDDDFTLEEVIVTAQKREENQQKVGIPMEIFSGELLKELGRYDVDQILSNVSSAFISRTSEGLRVSLRGVAFDTPSGYGEGAVNAAGTVGVYTDNIFTAKRPTGTGLYDIERVEVLFGPQATIYASNAPGGIVNFVLKKPSLDAYDFSASLEYGNYNLLHFEGAVNVPVSETFAIRGAFNSVVRDGYLSNGGEDEDSQSGRLRLLWEPSNNFSFLVTGEYETSTGRGITGVPAFIDEDDVADPWYTDVELTGVPREATLKKFNAQIKYDFGYGVLSIIPAIADDDYYRTASGPAPGPPPPQIRDTVTTGWGSEDGYEIRIDSPSDSKFVWNLGYNWYEEENYRRNTATVRGTGQVIITDHYQKVSQKALLANLMFPFTDTFRGVAGLRKSDDEAKSYRYCIDGDPTCVPTASVMPYDDWDYKIGMEYDINETSMLYANYSTSYRIEGEAMDKDGNTLPHQEIEAYTAGIKNRFLDNTLQVNLSGYYYDYTNRIHMAMVFASINPDGTYCAGPPGPPPFGCIMRPDEGGRVPGDLRMYGLDLQNKWNITRKDKIGLSISYLDSWLERMQADYEFKDQPTYDGDADWGNRRPTFSPEWTVAFDYSHIFYLPNGSFLTARIDIKYQSEYDIDWWEERMGRDQRGYRTQEAHHIDNFTLTYATPDGKWTFGGYVKNLFDYAEKRFMNIGMDMTIGQPRTYGALLTYKF